MQTCSKNHTASLEKYFDCNKISNRSERDDCQTNDRKIAAKEWESSGCAAVEKELAFRIRKDPTILKRKSK